MYNKVSFLLLFFLSFCLRLTAIEHPFSWKGSDTLVVNDGLSEQLYFWQDGLLRLVQSSSLSDNHAMVYSNSQPDRTSEGKPQETHRKISRFEETERSVGYYQLDLRSVYKNFELIRRLRKYDGVPGIEWSMLVKGEMGTFQKNNATGAELIEDPELLSGSNPHYFCLPFSTPHYTTTTVSFREATDHHTNAIHRRASVPYRKSQYYRGSVLLAKDRQTGDFHLIVKKSPIERAQARYSGFDFSTDFSGVKVHSPGIDHSQERDETAYPDEEKRADALSGSLLEDIWQKTYPLFVLMHAENEEAALEAYKLHELAIHRYLPFRDNTFTMNTWGDRNRDSRVNEAFILNELGVAARLGITHYQIDDGWQQGLSRNSAAKAGLLWDDWNASDWEVNPRRFPAGLTKVKREADRFGIKLGLWFNPSKSNFYAGWKRDQEILLGLHARYGISWIKIDGLEIGNKLSEERVKKMLGGATEKSDGHLQFNMDVTAGQRGGFFYFNHFGNIFLENRYTDWGNYYPHLTLRNAWMLARYVPIQRFQLEWLNKWRNDNQYPKDDPLKPSQVPFDYQFAITMMGQPLAWMEATGLPEEAFRVTPVIEAWKEVRDEMQKGVISPVGEEPNGYSFPGFISMSGRKIFVLLFRELTTSTGTTYVLPQCDVTGKRFVRLAGDGQVSSYGSDHLEVNFQKPFQFLLGYFE